MKCYRSLWRALFQCDIKMVGEQIGVMDANKKKKKKKTNEIQVCNQSSTLSNNFDPRNVVSIENNAFLFIYVKSLRWHNSNL